MKNNTFLAFKQGVIDEKKHKENPIWSSPNWYKMTEKQAREMFYALWNHPLIKRAIVNCDGVITLPSGIKLNEKGVIE